MWAATFSVGKVRLAVNDEIFSGFPLGTTAQSPPWAFCLSQRRRGKEPQELPFPNVVVVTPSTCSRCGLNLVVGKAR